MPKQSCDLLPITASLNSDQDSSAQQWINGYVSTRGKEVLRQARRARDDIVIKYYTVRFMACSYTRKVLLLVPVTPRSLTIKTSKADHEVYLRLFELDRLFALLKLVLLLKLSRVLTRSRSKGESS